MISSIKNVQTKITNEYNVPPKYIENLQSIEKILTNILSQPYGNADIHEAAITIPAEKSIQE